MPVHGDHRSFCRLCAAACGIVVTVEDERVVRVRGDAEHPVSRGYTCVKGRALGDFHHREDRLSAPRIDGREVAWDELLDDLGSRLGQLAGESGADAIAMYLATGFAYDSAAQVASATWLAMTGSTSFYTAATVDNAPVLVAAEMVAGNAMANPVWDPTSAGLLVLVGTNPVVSHGYGTTLPDPIRYLREHRGRGGRLWVLDPRRTETAALADEYVDVRPGGDVAVLAWLAREVLAVGPRPDTVSSEDAQTLAAVLAPFDLDRAAGDADVDPAALVRLRRRRLGPPGPAGDGVRNGRHHECRRCPSPNGSDGCCWPSLTRSTDPAACVSIPGSWNRLRPPRPGGSAARPAARSPFPARSCEGGRSGPGGRARRRDRGGQRASPRRRRWQPPRRPARPGADAGLRSHGSTCSRWSTSSTANSVSDGHPCRRRRRVSWSEPT